jgi:hypothetical protein
LTIAATIATEPRRAGRRNATASTEAVTTGPRARVLAARPAATSIQERTAPPGFLLLFFFFGGGERERECEVEVSSSFVFRVSRALARAREKRRASFFTAHRLAPSLLLSLTAADPQVIDVRGRDQLVEHDSSG